MAWIGEPGKRFEFKCPSSMEVTASETRVRFTSMLGRVSITDHSAVPNPRTWQIGLDVARPEDIAQLEALAGGEFGLGPFHWVPPAAETQNLLERGAAVCLGHHPQPGGVTPGGPIRTGEGWAGRSLLRKDATHVVLGYAPVVPRRPVSVRAWCEGPGTQLRVTALAASGNTIGESTSTPVDAGPVAGGSWVGHTYQQPVDAVRVRVDVLGALSVTRPSVTWDTPGRVWTHSKASMSVSVQPIPTTVLRATGRAGEETLTSHAFEIQEVG